MTSPTRERWQPLRCGLIDLYRYDEQEFAFVDGRLLLRGNNGTGKTRVLALTLPFLLDGETSPHRFEPDGDSSKRIEWNLLMDKVDDRRGCTWIEFGRRDVDGTEHFCTLACVLHAVKGRSLQRFFFITRQRVGQDLHLVDEHRRLLGRDRLKLALAGAGELVDTVDAWRATVDKALFGLGPRYRALMDLLVQLRKPQLTRQLDEKELSERLSNALAPLSVRVVEPLAEAFRALEEDRNDLDGVVEAARSTVDFLGRYRAYAAVAARRRAGELRTRHSAYEQAGREVLRATEAEAEAANALVQARSGLADTEGQLADAQVRLETLQRDPALDRARELTQAEQAAAEAARSCGDATRQRDAAGTRHAGNEAEARQLTAARNAAAALAAHALNELRPLAAPLGLEDVLPAAVDDVADEWAWRDRLDRRRRDAAQLAKQEGAVRTATKAVEQAEQERLLRQHDLDAARELEAEAGRNAAEARTTLRADVLAWLGRCVLLRLGDADVLCDELDAWSEEVEGPSPVTTAAQAARAEAEAAVATRRAQVQADRTGALAEKQSKELELARLAAGGHAPPLPAATRARDSGRAGAPLWALCAFSDDVSEDHRAGLEAALEASGLLDAWVTPEGAVLTDLDAALTLESPLAASPLLGLVLPTGHDAVPDAVVAGVLQRIGLAEGPVSVDVDGRYRLGPLQGAWRKAEAEHIGETARRRARERKIVELRAEVAALVTTIASLDGELQELAAQERAVRQEAGAAPDGARLRQVVAQLQAARTAVNARYQQVEAVDQRLRERRTTLEGAEAERDALVTDLRLDAWRGQPDALRHALETCATGGAAFIGRVHTLQGAAAAQAGAERRLSQSVADLAEAEARLMTAADRLRGATVTRDTLREAFGSSIDEILGAVKEAEAARNSLVVRRKGLQRDLEHALADAAAKQERVVGAQRAEEAAAEARLAALDRMRSLVRAGLVGVLELSAPGEDAAAGRMVELARAVEHARADVDAGEAAWDRVQDALHRELEGFRGALLERRWEPAMHTDDGLSVIDVNYGDGRLRLPEFLGRLRADEQARRAFLSEREREVIETHLVGELANELHDRILAGERLVREMSTQVERRSTSTGMRLRFHWRVAEHAGDAVSAARSRLMRASATWSPADRQLISDFLRGRLDDERQRSPGHTWQQQIEAAFDYRAWHHFEVERHQEGRWLTLNRRTHGTGSGGEKAIALTIPQLAAAAAYYQNASPHAPRIILLDEAFVGIDGDMRAKSMGLLASFDLDFMITSEREWACYATLPGVSICQLATVPGIDAVDVVHWIWNGQERALA